MADSITSVMTDIVICTPEILKTPKKQSTSKMMSQYVILNAYISITRGRYQAEAFKTYWEKIVPPQNVKFKHDIPTFCYSSSGQISFTSHIPGLIVIT